MMNIYVGNFSYDITGDDLIEVFGAFGQVDTAKVIRDKYTGESKGFGFVEMPIKAEAQAALLGVQEIKGKIVSINEARALVKTNYGSFKQNKSKRHESQRKERRY